MPQACVPVFSASRHYVKRGDSPKQQLTDWSHSNLHVPASVLFATRLQVPSLSSPIPLQLTMGQPFKQKGRALVAVLRWKTA
jgi:hypothetical protein